MIPKNLHYIWLGNNKSDLANECISSYSKFLSDFKIYEWNEQNIDIQKFDVPLRNFYTDFYSKKLYAFCSDIARLYILRDFGGIYVDTDTKFIKKFPETFLEKPFLCRINPTQEICNGCIWGCDKYDSFINACIRWFSECLEKYYNLFGKKWIFNRILNRFFSLFGFDYKNKETQSILNYIIYSAEYFNPMNYITHEIYDTNKTIAIHYYARSWRS